MFDIICCCRFGQRETVFVVLLAAAPGAFAAQLHDRRRQQRLGPKILWHDGDWRCARPSLARAQKRPRLLERLAAAPPRRVLFRPELVPPAVTTRVLPWQ